MLQIFLSFWTNQLGTNTTKYGKVCVTNGRPETESDSRGREIQMETGGRTETWWDRDRGAEADKSTFHLLKCTSLRRLLH